MGKNTFSITITVEEYNTMLISSYIGDVLMTEYINDGQEAAIALLRKLSQNGTVAGWVQERRRISTMAGIKEGKTV